MTDPRESGTIIGVVGNDVPRQLLLAAGARPYRLTGSWDSDVDAETSDLLGAADAVTVRILSELRAGGPHLDALIICNDDQSHLRLFYALRALNEDLPLHLLDMPGGRSASARRFAQRQYRALVDFCAGVTGHRPDEESLTAAADDEEALGRALANLRRARRADPPRCSGARALQVYLNASRLSPAAAVEAAEDARDGEPLPGVRVHVTGSSHPDPTVYREIEDRGCTIVGEDHDTGDRAWLGEAVASGSLDEVIDGLVDAHFVRVPGSAGAFSAERAELTAGMAADAQAAVVVSLIRDLDEAPLWDLPDQRAALDLDRMPLLTRTHIGPGEQLSAARELATRSRETGARA
ncbi:hypothetical protein SRABI76_01396 [Microbacterium oxydans]|uniref:2-hydroxyacyl-CoA dehydratase family protein n=1 Tax=Microbacterium oxydans TaxID=82380 RepID=UPI001DC25B80|nr:2-hydroxyacyl-CoA dehydratase family protein [Microbacterium oxydans]CAH0175719.1 hypothetical protein SRABI76_01396 [Microbacterium oxydans]